MEHSQLKQQAKWNPAQDAWVTEQSGLFCEHLDVYSETLPKQGTTLNGILYELPTGVHHTGGSGSSSSHGQGSTGNQDWRDVPLLMTPAAARDYKDHVGEVAKHRPNDKDTLNRAIAHLLPTPAVNDMDKAYDPDSWDEWVAKQKAAHGNGNGHGKSLHIEALRMLPTPEASRAGGTAEAHLARKMAADGHSRAKVTNLDVLAASASTEWGDYAPAISRWESLTRPAPEPTLPTGRDGKHQLSAPFVEWMMGLPEGWVTATDTTRNEQLKALGNGVVPQQAAQAIRFALSDEGAFCWRNHDLHSTFVPLPRLRGGHYLNPYR